MKYVKLFVDTWLCTDEEAIRVEAMRPGLTLKLCNCPNLHSISVVTYKRPVVDENGRVRIIMGSDRRHIMQYEDTHVPFELAISYWSVPNLFSIVKRYMHMIGYAPFICERYQTRHEVLIVITGATWIICEQQWAVETCHSIEQALHPRRG